MSITDRLHAIDRRQQQMPRASFIAAVLKKFGDDQAGNLAALIAYSALVAIFPLLLVLVTVLDIVLGNHPALQHRLLNSALSHYPLIGQQLGHIGALHQSGLALVVGLLGTFIGARSVATAIQNALNTVWEIPFARRPGFPWSWLRSFGGFSLASLPCSCACSPPARRPTARRPAALIALSTVPSGLSGPPGRKASTAVKSAWSSAAS